MSHGVAAGHVSSCGHCHQLDCLWKASQVAFQSRLEFKEVPVHEASVPALTSQCFGRSSLPVQKHLVLFLLLPAPLNVELKGNTIHHLPRGLPFSQE